MSTSKSRLVYPLAHCCRLHVHTAQSQGEREHWKEWKERKEEEQSAGRGAVRSSRATLRAAPRRFAATRSCEASP